MIYKNQKKIQSAEDFSDIRWCDFIEIKSIQIFKFQESHISFENDFHSDSNSDNMELNKEASDDDETYEPPAERKVNY